MVDPAVVEAIADVLDDPRDDAVIDETRAAVRDCCVEHPIYDDGVDGADAPEADR